MFFGENIKIGSLGLLPENNVNLFEFDRIGPYLFSTQHIHGDSGFMWTLIALFSSRFIHLVYLLNSLFWHRLVVII